MGGYLRLAMVVSLRLLGGAEGPRMRTNRVVVAPGRGGHQYRVSGCFATALG